MTSSQTPELGGDAGAATHILAGYTAEDQFGKQINKGLRTLRAWRQQRIGPPWIKIGNAIFYSDAGARAWLRSLEVQPARSRKAV